MILTPVSILNTELRECKDSQIKQIFWISDILKKIYFKKGDLHFVIGAFSVHVHEEILCSTFTVQI